MKKLLISAVFLFSSLGIFAQVDGESIISKFGLAVQAKASISPLPDYGGEAVISFTNKLALRIGYSSFQSDLAMINDYIAPGDLVGAGGLDLPFDITTAYDYSSTTLSFIADYYVARYLYVSAGIAKFDRSLSVDILPTESYKFNDIEFTTDEIGHLKLAITPEKKWAPYVGLGLGRNIAKNGRVAFNIEIGNYFGGLPDFSTDASGLLEGNKDPSPGNISETLESLEGIQGWNWYPSVKVGLSFRIF